MPITNQSLISKVDRKLPIIKNPNFGDAVNFRQSSEEPVHRWFRYREGFSPKILDAVKSSKTIFDPFCGCGTTLIEARRRGIDAWGTDVNPLATFIARTKTVHYRRMDKNLFNELGKAAITSKYRTPAKPPAMPILGKVFQSESLRELLKIRGFIDEIDNGNVRNLLFLCWLNILEECSNVFKEGNGIKYRNKKRRPGKYETLPDDIWIPKYFGKSITDFVRHKWQTQCSKVSADLSGVMTSDQKIEIIDGSCLEDAVLKKVSAVDSALFSPPYANRFDYFEAFKLELWMGNFVNNSNDLRNLRKQAMRSNLTVSDGEAEYFEPLEKIMALMDPQSSSVRMGIKNTLRGYFEDMRTLADHLHSKINAGGRMVCVIGNSAYAGALIPTDSLCAIIFERCGFKVESINVARHLTVSSQQRALIPHQLQKAMRESIIVCKRMSRRRTPTL